MIMTNIHSKSEHPGHPDSAKKKKKKFQKKLAENEKIIKFALFAELILLFPHRLCSVIA